jgi:hypothetical protein
MRRARTRKAMWCTVAASIALVGVFAVPADAARPFDPFSFICRRWTEQYRPATGRTVVAYPQTFLADRCLRLNQVQVIGSHNSYHIRPQEPVWSALKAFDPALAASLEYTHAPLAQQFDTQEVRQIELDVFADPAGGLYDQRHLLPLLGLPADSGEPALEKPGFKVLHVQEIDFLSRCLTFVTCLRQVKSWSDAHPTHLPLAVLVELKDTPIPDPVHAGFVTPRLIGPAELDALDTEIRSVFPPSRVITPDSVRGSRPTLEDAVLHDGWPGLGEARGKVMFLMDNGGRYRTDYLAGHPSLAGRMLFTSADPGNADAAFVKRNDPLGINLGQIQDLVRRGYLVRTRADADTAQARTGDTSMRDAALASGAQWVSTDYPVPGLSAMFGTNYVAQVPDGSPARCNPVNTARWCRNASLERLRPSIPVRLNF